MHRQHYKDLIKYLCSELDDYENYIEQHGHLPRKENLEDILLLAKTIKYVYKAGKALYRTDHPDMYYEHDHHVQHKHYKPHDYHKHDGYDRYHAADHGYMWEHEDSEKHNPHIEGAMRERIMGAKDEEIKVAVK